VNFIVAGVSLSAIFVAPGTTGPEGQFLQERGMVYETVALYLESWMVQTPRVDISERLHEPSSRITIHLLIEERLT
jgi:hypothetical protein